MTGRKSNAKWIVGGIVIFAVIIGMSFMTMTENSVYFYTPDEAVVQAKTLASKTIRVGGMVQPSSQKWHAETLDLQFVLTDFKGHDIHVRHKGTPPDMFKEGSGVIVEGKIAETGDRMASKKLMVKHSEEYKKPGEAGSIDKELVKESMFKD